MVLHEGVWPPDQILNWSTSRGTPPAFAYRPPAHSPGTKILGSFWSRVSGMNAGDGGRGRLTGSRVDGRPLVD